MVKCHKCKFSGHFTKKTFYGKIICSKECERKSYRQLSLDIYGTNGPKRPFNQHEIKQLQNNWEK